MYIIRGAVRRSMKIDIIVFVFISVWILRWLCVSSITRGEIWLIIQNFLIQEKVNRYVFCWLTWILQNNCTIYSQHMWCESFYVWLFYGHRKLCFSWNWLDAAFPGIIHALNCPRTWIKCLANKIYELPFSNKVFGSSEVYCTDWHHWPNWYVITNKYCQYVLYPS